MVCIHAAAAGVEICTNILRRAKKKFHKKRFFFSRPSAPSSRERRNPCTFLGFSWCAALCTARHFISRDMHTTAQHTCVHIKKLLAHPHIYVACQCAWQPHQHSRHSAKVTIYTWRGVPTRENGVKIPRNSPSLPCSAPALFRAL